MMNRFLILALAVVLAAGLNARAQVYVAYANSGVISEYDQATGAVTNDTFVLGLKEPRGICLANGVLYVLQAGSGYIGTYNMQTGAAIRPELVGGLNQPVAMTVDHDAIYVSDYDWQTHQARIGKYNAFTGAVIKPSLVTLTGTSYSGAIFSAAAPVALAVSGTKLFALLPNGSPNDAHVFDTTTGAPGKEYYSYILSGSEGLMTSGKWLWTTAGANAPSGCVFKIDTLATPEFQMPGMPLPFHPLFHGLDYPSKIAISGDDLFVGDGRATGIGKYSATSGAVINANFIPSQHDRLGGLAVVQRDLTADEISADASYDWQQTLSHFAFMLMLHENSLVGGASVVFALGMGVLVALLFRRKMAAPVGPVEETAVVESPITDGPAPMAETYAPEIVEESPRPIDPLVDESTVPAEAPVARSFSTLAIVASVLFLTTLVAFAVMGYLVMQPVAPTGYPENDPFANLIGAWEFDSMDSGDNSQKPVMLSLWVYPDHADFSEGSGPLKQEGTWHDNGFWIKNADGSGETEAARIVDPLDIEVHVHAFIPSRSDVVVLYKSTGSAAEKAALAAKYPGPITYPPPKGVITYYMSEYDLKSLPWQAKFLSSGDGDDEPYSHGITYHYRSDDPKVPELEVTLKNRRVVKISGGYE